MKALYRKYRSKTLEEVVGQEHITETLKRALKSGSTNHAYLFTGPRGVGKTSVARILAHELNELAYTDETMHLDIIEIDAASNRRIDDIRELREKVHISPVSSRYKVYIIDEVHMLTGESFNALLKTLEEPPEHVVFILATTEVHKLPATIVSRTQRFHFRPVPKDKVVSHLKFIADKEDITIDQKALELIAEHGEGSFRDSISLLDQLASMTNQQIEGSFVEQVLGLAGQQTVETIESHIINGDTKMLHELLDSLEVQGVNAVVLTQQLIRQLRRTAYERRELYGLIDQLLTISKSQQSWLKLFVTLLQASAENTSDIDSPKLTKSTPLPDPGKRPRAKAAPVVNETPVKTISKTPAEVRNPEPETPPAEQPHPARTSSGKTFDIACWPLLLEELQRSNPPLLSILRKAEPRIENSQLVVAFRFKLHKLKLEDSRYRTKFMECIDSLGYECPNISVIHDAAAVAYQIVATTEAAPADETTSSVLAMMGGGEVVNG